MKKRIAVIGLGQIGGSIVLTLRSQSANYHITGIDTSVRRLRLLRPNLDASSTKWKAAHKADLVVLCLHYRKIMEYLRHASRDQLLLDVCSSKEKIVQFASRRKLRFIGGHPLAGNERVGEKGWSEKLFDHAPFFITPTKTSNRSDLILVKHVIADLGARPVLVDPAAHDRYLAMSSHFPAFLSLLFAKTTRIVPPIFQGPGYRSMTRLSSTSAELLETFLLSNETNIKKCAKQLRRKLDLWLKSPHRVKAK